METTNRFLQGIISRPPSSADSQEMRCFHHLALAIEHLQKEMLRIERMAREADLSCAAVAEAVALLQKTIDSNRPNGESANFR